jgi:hypothetical protein
MKLDKNSITSSLSAILLALLVGGSGFYFGFKTNFKTNESVNAENNSKTIQKPVVEATNKVVEQIVTKEVLGVQWIKPNQSPTCDKDHPIKGKFSKTNYYYTKSAKTYDRVSPDICFTTEEFARDTAGFIKKF